MLNGGVLGGIGSRPPSDLGCGGSPAGGAPIIKIEAERTAIINVLPNVRCEDQCTENDGEKCVRPNGHQGNHYCCNGHIWSHQSK